MSVDVPVNRHRIFVPRSHPEHVIIDVISQAVWYVTNPWCLFGKEIGQELTVPVQHLYSAGVTITHQDVRKHVSTDSVWREFTIVKRRYWQCGY